MHVMIATDGSVDADKTTEIVARLSGDDGTVTVYSVVEVPRGLLNDMRAAAGASADPNANDTSVEYRTSQAGDPTPSGWIGDDAVITRYVNNKVRDRTSELIGKLEAAGVEHTVIGVEGENAARSVLDAVTAHHVDMLCIGTHGLGRFEGLLGSISTKICRRATCPVVLIR